jgi:hypothetical protein
LEEIKQEEAPRQSKMLGSMIKKLSNQVADTVKALQGIKKDKDLVDHTDFHFRRIYLDELENIDEFTKHKPFDNIPIIRG